MPDDTPYREPDGADYDLFSREEDERAAMAMVPLADEIARFVRSKIPDGTDYGVLLFAKPPEGQILGRVIALTSDRDRVAAGAAQWVLSVLRPESPHLLTDAINRHITLNFSSNPPHKPNAPEASDAPGGP